MTDRGPYSLVKTISKKMGVSSNVKDTFWTILGYRCLAEFVGTALIAIVSIVIGKSYDFPSAKFAGRLTASICLYIMLNFGAPISGAMYNSGLTLSFVLRKNHFFFTPFYWVSPFLNLIS